MKEIICTFEGNEVFRRDSNGQFTFAESVTKIDLAKVVVDLLEQIEISEADLKSR